MQKISDDLLEPDNRPTQADSKSLFPRLTAIVESFLLRFNVVHVHKLLSAGDDAFDTPDPENAFPHAATPLSELYHCKTTSTSRRCAALLKSLQSQLPRQWRLNLFASSYSR